MLTAAGVGGPGLTTAAFQAGIANMQATLEHNAAERIHHEAARNVKTFTGKYRDALAQCMHHLCNTPDDAGLPDVHNLLVKAPNKSHNYPIIQGLIQEQTQASAVPLPVTCAPLTTTKLVDQVFRNFCLGGNGLTFGQGLTPFAVVCEGQADVEDIRTKIKQATIAEAGTSVSLDDVQRISTSDICFPTDARSAEEKLYGFSIIVDLFHGVGHPVATSIRAMAIQIGPSFHRLVSQYADSPAKGMDLICRVLYDIQQDYFTYVSQVASGACLPAPVFARLANLVHSFLVDSLSALPATWYNLVNAPVNGRSVREKHGREDAQPSP